MKLEKEGRVDWVSSMSKSMPMKQALLTALETDTANWAQFVPKREAVLLELKIWSQAAPPSLCPPNEKNIVGLTLVFFWSKGIAVFMVCRAQFSPKLGPAPAAGARQGVW